MTIKIRVKGTSPTLMCDAEVQHQRHQTSRVHQEDIQMYVPTMTPAFSHLSRFHLLWCVEKVSELLDRQE